jgi:hypothetical protein
VAAALAESGWREAGEEKEKLSNPCQLKMKCLCKRKSRKIMKRNEKKMTKKLKLCEMKKKRRRKCNANK